MVKKNTLILSLAMLIIFSSIAGFVVAHEGSDNFGHHDMMDDGSHGGEWISVYGWIFTVGIMIILVIIVLVLIKQLKTKK